MEHLFSGFYRYRFEHFYALRRLGLSVLESLAVDYEISIVW